MIVVCNTSRIVNLAAIEQLDLLHKLFRKIIIPQGVYHEIIRPVGDQPGIEEVQTFDWIVKKDLSTSVIAEMLKIEVDDGEAEAIALAIDIGADLLLIDERIGRALASRLGIKCLGVLGVLILAKKNGHIKLVKPLIDDLVIRAGFWMSQDLLKRVLELVSE